MSNLSGWGLTARLISKHFGAVGDKVAESIAAFDPETATAADREALAAKLRDAATKLAKAKMDFQHEHEAVTQLQQLINGDTNAAGALQAKLESGALTEAQVNAFLDELEANKAKLATETQQEADAKAFMDEIQKVVDALSKQLADFDAQAKKAEQQLQAAQAQRELQDLRAEQQETLNSMRNLTGTSTALSALAKKAQAVQASAEAEKIVTDAGSVEANKSADVDAIRASLATPQGETALERIKRLTAGQ